MIVAEELEADWSKVRIEQAPADPAYGDPSGAATNRPTAAAAFAMLTLSAVQVAGREMLIAAAAKSGAFRRTNACGTKAW